MRFYFSAQFLGIIMFIFMLIVVTVGLTIGYGWHIVSESIDFATLQSAGTAMFNDTVKSVTITALLLPYLVSAYIAGRLANKAEYFNAIVLAAILLGPVAYYYPPRAITSWLFFIVPAMVMLLGAVMAHWTRVSDEKKIADGQKKMSNSSSP